MCGIALVLSGRRRLLVSSSASGELHGGGIRRRHELKETRVSVVDDLKAALRRRGPDRLGCKRLRLCTDGTSYAVILEDEEEGDKRKDGSDDFDGDRKMVAELCFLGAALQLRGAEPVSQPLVAPSGSILVYNGEIFGGIHVAGNQNDTESLLSALETCCYCDCHALNRDEACSCCGNGGRSVPQVLSTIKGPWALIYWQVNSKTIWFGRDAFGRRSLLVHWPTPDDSRFILSSVSPPSARQHSASISTVNGSQLEAASDMTKVSCWEELPCGIYSIHLKPAEQNIMCIKEELDVEVRKHEWKDSSLHNLVHWQRKSTVPTMEDLPFHHSPFEKERDHLPQALSYSNATDRNTSGIAEKEHPLDGCFSLTNSVAQPALRVLIALQESVMLRTNVNSIFQGDPTNVTDEELAPIAILFSGGLDSMILAALLDQCLDSKWTIDLLNVSFDGQLAPDRVSAIAGLGELRKISPLRRWRLVEIDTALSDLKWEVEHVMSLIQPSKTYMDLNIGVALWLAAGGDGWVNGSMCGMQEGCRYKYKSKSRILLVGSGADEQCAGYGRHRTKYRLGGWVALDEEMRLDVQRIWKRNMGRDDRCISDHGKEARFPFLDENVVKTLLEIPLWEITKLDEPAGKGDKKILREPRLHTQIHTPGAMARILRPNPLNVAKLLGLQEAALQPKRAIQFGSRIARESNRKNFGSNRAANNASAGSVEINQCMQ